MSRRGASIIVVFAALAWVVPARLLRDDERAGMMRRLDALDWMVEERCDGLVLTTGDVSGRGAWDGLAAAPGQLGDGWWLRGGGRDGGFGAGPRWIGRGTEGGAFEILCRGDYQK